MKEMIRNGFDNLGQKSEPFSADHRLVLVSNFVGGNILDFSNRVSVSAENGATEKKIRDHRSNCFFDSHLFVKFSSDSAKVKIR